MIQTEAEDDKAACWCIRGAVRKIGGTYATESALCNGLRKLQGDPLRPAFGSTLAEFNDAPHRRHDEVIKVIDFAIEIEEAKSHGTEA